MAKLYFRYGAMGSSKSANLLMVRYNYEERGQYAVLLKPETDQRDGVTRIRSRMGLSAEGMLVSQFIALVQKEWNEEQHEILHLPENGKTAEKKISAILVDEAQFLKASEVDFFSDIVDFYQIPVLCYGLRTDFQLNFFPGSKRLMEIADIIEEVPTICWCGHRAQCNARFTGDRIVREGEQVLLGANESYVSLCRRHFKEGKLREDQ